MCEIGIKSQNFVWPIFGPHNNLLDVLEKKVVILVINFFQQVWKEFSVSWNTKPTKS